MLAEGLRAGPNENSMQTLKQRFYSAVIIPPLWQMKMSMAGRENNEVIKKRTGHGAWPPPPSYNPKEGSPAMMSVKRCFEHKVGCLPLESFQSGKLAHKVQSGSLLKSENQSKTRVFMCGSLSPRV